MMKPRALLRRPVLLAALVLLSACQDDAPAGEAVEVPSGRALSLIEIVTNARGPEGATARFRFLAPDLVPEDAEAAFDDMQAVCDSFAIQRIDGMVPAPRQIVISFASEVVPFGEPAPDVVQFFEAYRPENGACVWEVF
ncbi:DUF6497 family protein [Rhodobacter sp. SY28-1]|uniref:DUF6497 family protein n=1 Tax=Rhodobacter sp. SY28-1 TaxID=2562317 RepID=UPI0010C00C4C|nr:DUF6497 family protein [Rhodobacter sp. SY28-1]